MKRIRTSFEKGLLLMAVLVLVLTACTPAQPEAQPTAAPDTSEEVEAAPDTSEEVEATSPPEPTAAPEPTAEPVVEGPSGTLVWGISADLQGTSWDFPKPEQWVYSSMFNGLIRFNAETFEVEPELAESWETSEDGLTWTFHLRDDVFWHDGEQFTSEDVKFSYDAIINPDNPTGYHRGNFADVASIEVVDDFTLNINMLNVNYDFLPLLGDFMHIFPVHLLEGVDITNDAQEFAANPIGTGPFKFESHILNESYTVVANPDYFRGPPLLERIVYKVLPDVSVRAAQMRTGELDVITDLGSPEAASLKDVEGLTLLTPPTIGYWHMFINNTTPYTDDIRIRQALHLAIDVEAIIESVMDGYGVRTAGPVGPPNGLRSNPDLEPYPYDPERAIELFAEVGWEDTDGDGILDKDVDGDGVRDPWQDSIIIIPFQAAWADVGLVVQQNWQAIGLDISLNQLDTNTGFGLVREDNYITYVGSRNPVPSSIDLSRYFGCDAPGNWFHYCNEDVDGFIAQAKQTADPDERRKLYYQAQEILLEDQPSLVMFNVVDLQVINECVVGYHDASARFNFLDVHLFSKDC